MLEDRKMKALFGFEDITVRIRLEKVLFIEKYFFCIKGKGMRLWSILF